jgi:hypothetical protein
MADKTMGDRAKECVRIITKLTDPLGLAICSDSDPVIELRQRMNDYIRSGEEWTGTIDFSRFDKRMAFCVFPKKANKTVEVTLKKII